MIRALLASLLLALAGCAATGQPEPLPPVAVATDGTVTVPSNLVINSPRICAALAVYELADHNDWGLRATIAATALNGYRAAEGVPNCAVGVAVALTQDFSQRRWQDALDAVDAVTTGSYSISPAACARATTVVRLSTADPEQPPAAQARCVIYDLAFLEVSP